MTFTEMPYDNRPPFLLEGTKLHFAKVRDGYLRILSCVEPLNDDGSEGLHVSVSHSSSAARGTGQDWRLPTDKEMNQVGSHFFPLKNYDEIDLEDSPVRHLWEKSEATK